MEGQRLFQNCPIQRPQLLRRFLPCFFVAVNGRKNGGLTWEPRTESGIWFQHFFQEAGALGGVFGYECCGQQTTTTMLCIVSQLQKLQRPALTMD